MHSELALLRLASRQFSAFTRVQALHVGLSPAIIKRRLDDGVWRRLHRGIYAPSAAPVTWQQRAMAACLACGPDAYASHLAAAAIWGIADGVDTPDVTIDVRCARSVPGIRIHRSRWREMVRHAGFPVTTPMRTLVDLAGVVSEEVLERSLDAAHRDGLITLRRLRTYLDLPRNLGRPGSGDLRRLVAMRDPDRRIGSDLETLFYRVLRRSGLPLPVAQHRVRTRKGYRFIDFAYPAERVAIEIDGYAIHGGRFAFDADRARQNELTEIGWQILRFTWTQISDQGAEVVVTIGVALGLMPVRWKRSSSNPSQRGEDGPKDLRRAKFVSL